MTQAEFQETSRQNIMTAILAIDAAIAANPTAVSYSINGQSVSHGELIDKRMKLQELLTQQGGPYEVNTHGFV